MAQIPQADKGKICPLHKQDMSKVCHKCPLWVHIRGKNPQSEDSVDFWNCSLAWLPTLLIENSQMQRQTGAAVESFRNDMVDANRATLQVLSQPPHDPKLINGERR
jgi:hypothetical protein